MNDNPFEGLDKKSARRLESAVKNAITDSVEAYRESHDPEDKLLFSTYLLALSSFADAHGLASNAASIALSKINVANLITAATKRKTALSHDQRMVA